METKIKKCPKCGLEKRLDSFHWKKSENRYNSWCKSCLYASQSNRWKDRKVKVIELMGGCCVRCGYNKNFSALDLHHLDPNIKDCEWKKLREKSWDKIIEEIKKCVLVCRNCHGEIHHPECMLGDNGELNDNNLLNYEVKSTGTCPTCDCLVYGTKYCSVNCSAIGSRRVKKRPSKELLHRMLWEMPTTKIAQRYGVTDVAVGKWAKSYGIKKPSRGYWAKLYAKE